MIKAASRINPMHSKRNQHFGRHEQAPNRRRKSRRLTKRIKMKRKVSVQTQHNLIMHEPTAFHHFHVFFRLRSCLIWDSKDQLEENQE